MILAGLCTMSLLTGCGDGKEGQNGKETDTTQTDAAQDYKALDYVTLGEYMGMELSVEKAEVTDEDLRQYVESTVKMYPAYETLDQDTVKEGDLVDLNYEGLMDGEAFDGGTADNYVLEIGSHSFIEGFEDGLVGAKVGEERSLDLKFPDPYQNNPDFSGKPVVFHVKINRIVQEKEMSYDTLNDAYVAERFGQETVEKFLDDMRSTLNSSNEYYAEANKRSAAITKLQEICKVNEVPQDLLKQRMKEYKKQAEESYKAQGTTLEAALKENNTTEEEFEEQTQGYVQSNLEFELILQAIADKEKITLDEEGYQAYVQSMMANYSIESEEALYQQYDEAYVRQTYVGNKVLDLILENAKITYTAPIPDSVGTDGDAKEKGDEQPADQEADGEE